MGLFRPLTSKFDFGGFEFRIRIKALNPEIDIKFSVVMI